MTPEQIAAKLTAAIAPIEAAKLVCPYQRPGNRAAPYTKPCSVCGATNNESCRREAMAAFECVAAVRAILIEQEQGK